MYIFKRFKINLITYMYLKKSDIKFKVKWKIQSIKYTKYLILFWITDFYNIFVNTRNILRSLARKLIKLSQMSTIVLFIIYFEFGLIFIFGILPDKLTHRKNESKKQWKLSRLRIIHLRSFQSIPHTPIFTFLTLLK